jgi:hypothetical protein
MLHVAMMLTALLFSLAETVVTQERNVSMEETLGWLKPKVTNNVILPDIKGKTSEVTKSEWTISSTSKCSLVWNAWKEGKERKPNNLLVTVALSLSDFDPKRVDVTHPAIYYNSIAYAVVTLNTTDGKNSIKWQIKDTSLESSTLSFRFRAGNTAGPSVLERWFNGSNLLYQPREKEMAERVKDAFIHAINLCGGQQGKPKKREPF